jgi:diguanylate cyclase (GGDEF)-like protein/PAS domain S-box-containing protein
MERIMAYARERGYTPFTSTLLEAWRVSIKGLSDAIIKATDVYGDTIPEFSPDDNLGNDPVTEFAVIEAKRHRRRGIPLQMFLGLFKYYRQTFEDLMTNAPEDRREHYRFYVVRCFDRFEVAFCSEWADLDRELRLKELQAENISMTNEKNKYLTLFESLSSPAFLLDSDNMVDSMNLAATDMLGLGDRPGTFYYNDQNGPHEKKTRKRHISGVLPWLTGELADFKAGQETVRQFERQTNQGAILKDYHVTLTRMMDVSGKFAGIIVVLNDITGPKHMGEVLARSEALFKGIYANAPNGIVLLDQDGHLIQPNEQFCDMTGYTKEELQHDAFTLLILPEDIEESQISLQQLLSHRVPLLQMERRILCKGGSVIWVDLRATVFRSPVGDVAGIVIITDITDRKKLENELKQLAITDSLTGANNRRQFMERGQIEMLRAKRYNRPMALLMIDIDHFKRINDNYGHGVGDMVLKALVKQCQSVLRETDIFGRIGGEEFAAVLVETKPEKGIQVAERIRTTLEKTNMKTESGRIRITISIGLTGLKESDQDLDSIVKRADRAMYKAKNAGRNKVVVL